MTASNDGLRIMGLHFILMSPGLHFISAVGIISLWRPAFLFYVGSLFSADFVFLGSPGLHFIWLDSLLSSEIFSVGASSGLHFLPYRLCLFPIILSSLTFSWGSLSGLHFHLGSSSAYISLASLHR